MTAPPEGISLKQRFPHCCRPRSSNIEATLWLCRVSVASACDAQSLPTSQSFKRVINVRLMRENDSIKSRDRTLTQTAPGILQSSVERSFWWSVGLHWSHFTARHIDAERYLLCLHEMSRDGTKYLYVMQWKWGWNPPGERRRGDGAAGARASWARSLTNTVRSGRYKQLVEAIRHFKTLQTFFALSLWTQTWYTDF